MSKPFKDCTKNVQKALKNGQARASDMEVAEDVLAMRWKYCVPATTYIDRMQFQSISAIHSHH